MKRLSLFITVLLTMLLVFGLSSCGEEAHEHSYVVKSAESKYLASAADCENAARYYYSCSCGEVGTETFAHGEMLAGYLEYQLSSDNSYYIVSGFVGAQADISLPNLHDGLPVFGIKEKAFEDNTTIKSITMPNSIQVIGSYAFAGCTSLESIVIPTSVKSISPYTFSGCTALETITLHSGIEELGTYAFEKCLALKSITLNEGLKTISDNAFDYCTALESISIPDTVTILGNMAFRHAESLKSVKFSTALKSIGNATFQYCVSLLSVELYENINTLGNSTFSYCDGLESIRILGDITNIGTATFYECQSLESIYYASTTSGDCGNSNYIFYNAGIKGDGITLTIAKDAVIPEGFFTPYVEDNMPKITNIVIEEGAVRVNGFANYNKLPYLTSITYPSSIIYSSYGAFNNSPWWDNQKIGIVCIDGIFYGYKCHCYKATPIGAVGENRVEPDCINNGSYDSVIYCEVCREELSREKKVITSPGHMALTAVKENRVEPDCVNNGSYDSVIYCEVCGEELSRKVRVITALGHTPLEAVEENRVEATCVDGSFDSVIYCEVCGYELSREAKVIPAEHNYSGTTCTECGMQYKRNGDYIYFGEYPQTIKSESVTITSTIDDRGYYLGSDGQYYAKVTANPYESGYTFSTGTTVTMGSVYYFKVEPIRWRILSEDGESAFILCDSIIANMAYQDDYSYGDGEYYTIANGAPSETYANNYEYSAVRKWLNITFYETAFSDLQREIILTTTVDNSVSSTGYSSNSYACENTEDKIFLLSYAEVTDSAYSFSSDYSDYDTVRRMQTSDYTRATGAYMSTLSFYYGNGCWWLRSPCYNYSFYAWGIDFSGYVYNSGYVSLGSRGVVSALQIRL